jgi:hypothetical protein
MNSAQGSLEELCKNGRLEEMLESYLELCASQPSEDGEISSEENRSKRSSRSRTSEQSRASFPNLAGFCRYLGIGTGELERLAAEYPSEHGKILAVLEDEALNSGLSATLISAYLKKRLGYDSTPKAASEGERQLQIRFEHDILKDGE